MDPATFVAELNEHLSHLHAFARRTNELDFAVSLTGEFRGMQDAGWATTITAREVFEELSEIARRHQQLTRAQYRHFLMLYCQLAEAGGVYESLKNLMGAVTSKPYLLWPFKDLVRVRKGPQRVVGPNANATFRDLARTARDIGMTRLCTLLESAFRDDVRNAVSHADYVIWGDGLRLPRRNGGHPAKVTFEEMSAATTRALAFFDLLGDYNSASIRSYDPPKTVVGRFSENPPMPWTIAYDPARGAFGISGSSPGAVVAPEYRRQSEINARLGGRVLATFAVSPAAEAGEIEASIAGRGFEPHAVDLDAQEMEAVLADIRRLGLWDDRPGARTDPAAGGALLLASPWGFRWLADAADFDAALPPPLLSCEFAPADGTAPPEGAEATA